MTDYKMHLDHIVIIVPNLAHIIEDINNKLGCIPVLGGKHPKYGTHNALLRINNKNRYKQYIEFLAIDPMVEPPKIYPPGLHPKLSHPKISSWAVYCKNIEATAQAMCSIGGFFDVGEIFSMSRKSVEGEILSWEIAYNYDSIVSSNGIIPFLINWGKTMHPADQLEKNNSCEIAELTMKHPDGGIINSELLKLGLSDLVIDKGPSKTIQLTLKNKEREYFFTNM